MESPFARRKVKRVGQLQDDQTDEGAVTNDHTDQLLGMLLIKPTFMFAVLTYMSPRLIDDIEAQVERPSLGFRNVPSKSKKRSSTRTTLGPGGTSMNDDDEDSTPVFVPKKSNLSRQAIEKSALRKASQLQPPENPSRSHDPPHPSYSADILNELKASTPSTPRDLLSQTDIPNDESSRNELDLASKFGSDLAIRHQSSAIPTDAEIQEKKARRARLAKEQEFVSLDSDGEAENEGADSDASSSSSNHDTSILPYTGPKRSKEGPSRIVEDEDELGEGFDDFVSDGGIALGKKAERAQKQKQKEDMRNQILNAQASDSASENDSDIERREVYEAAQRQKGMDGLGKRKGDVDIKPQRPRTPPKISPLPTLSGVLERLKERKQAGELERKVQRQQLDAVRGELKDIEERKVEVQRLMKEAGERFEKLREEVEAEEASRDEPGEMGLAEKGGLDLGLEGSASTQGRGLESWGTV